MPSAEPVVPISGRPRFPISRGRGRLVGMPVVVATSLAVAVGLSSPAHGSETEPAQDDDPRPIGGSDRLRAVQAPVEPVIATTASGVPSGYIVVDGDTVSGIAARFGVSTGDVLSLNGLDWSSTIFPGQELALPQAGTPTAEPAAPTSGREHTVAWGETVSGIAGSYGASTDDVLRANGLSAASLIHPGDRLVIPGAAAPAAPMAATPAPQAGAGYTVVSGDTIGAIASRHGLTVDAVLAANDLTWTSIIYPGQSLVLPGATSVAAASPVVPVASAGAVELTPEMEANARAIIAIAREIGVSDQAVVIALATAMQESTLRNLDYGDRDSLGLFQQRPSTGWGTPEQVRDVRYSTLAFFGGPTNPNSGSTIGLLDIDGWESMSVTDAAQAVQISAYPYAYARWEESARVWLSRLG